MEYVILFFSIINLLLGFLIMLRPPYTKSNVAFFVFALLASLWTFNNFYLRLEPEIFFLRLAYSLGLIVATAGLFWSFHFLKEKIPRYFYFVYLPLTLYASIVSVTTHYVVDALYEVTTFGYEGELGKYFTLYSLYFSVIIFTIIFNYLRKLHRTSDLVHRSQIILVLSGVVVFSVVSFGVSMLVPTLFDSLRLTLIDNLSFSFFLIVIVVATLRFRLFNLKIVATELFVFALWIFILIRTILSSDMTDRILNGVLFGISVVIGLFLIRSVIREVEQREEIERLAKDLKKANERLRELDKLKSQFLSIASHDLRAPLTAIRNFMSLLLDGTYGKLPPAASEGTQQVFDRATEMAEMVDNYLNVSRIEQGRMKYDMADFDFANTLSEVVTQFKPVAEEKGLKLSCSIPDTQYLIRGDEAKLREVIENLVSNSINYTPEGTISVTLEKIDNRVRLVIEDTGIGMTEETKRNLFKLFNPGEDSRTYNPKSTGVGLYITKAHVEAHKGTVKAESEGKGKGSRFVVELPLSVRV